MDPPAPTAEHIASVWVTRASPKPKEPQGLSGDDPASPLPTKPIAIHPNRPSTDSNNNDAPRPSGAPAPAAGAPQQLAPAKRTSSANSGGSSRTISDNGAAPQMQAVAAEALLAAAAAAAEAEDARDAAVAGRKGGSSGGHRDVTSSPVVGRERVPRVTSPRRGNRTSNHGNSAGQHALMVSVLLYTHTHTHTHTERCSWTHKGVQMTEPASPGVHVRVATCACVCVYRVRLCAACPTVTAPAPTPSSTT